ncbi:MAG: hypothetical protein ACRDG3_11180 [Tepidiformaceae bacterium]
MDTEAGKRFAQAVAGKDREALLTLLRPEIDFRGMTPDQFWEANSAKTLVDGVLFGSWFEPQDHIEALERVETGEVGDRRRVSYRLRLSNADAKYVVEQQAYFTVEGGRINWLRIMCSGFRPIEERQA